MEVLKPAFSLSTLRFNVSGYAQKITMELISSKGIAYVRVPNDIHNSLHKPIFDLIYVSFIPFQQD